jgi:hypothetical protein
MNDQSVSSLPTRFGDSNQSPLNEGSADNNLAGVARIFEGCLGVAATPLHAVSSCYLGAAHKLSPHIASHEGRIASHDYRLEARAKIGFV